MQRAPVFKENVTQNVPAILTARLQSVCSLADNRKGSGLSQNVISLVMKEYIGSSRQTNLSTRGLGSLPYQSYKITMVWDKALLPPMYAVVFSCRCRTIYVKKKMTTTTKQNP